MKSNLIDIFGRVHAETERAVRFSETGEDDEAVWLPRSQIDFEPASKAG